ncbi:MAG: L-2-amino-thiazoline-4-carboxylic acid hydrolase [Thermoplasmata archaeon]|nr:L-2-amino-thiazoline-4-carboxylic acid hydrolase [Thermoplasmata archaeon]
MSLRLATAKLWMRTSVLKRELGRVAEMTIATLDEMVREHAPEALEAIRVEDSPMDGDLDQRRRAMADAHQRRVTALVEAMGEEAAVEEGRRRISPVGVALGIEARERLGVGDDIEDLVQAAKVVYTVLGIEVDKEEGEDGTLVLRVDRCSLSEVYDPVTCRLMSAADEGLVRGLNPNVQMTFNERITEGRPQCRADLVMTAATEGA